MPHKTPQALCRTLVRCLVLGLVLLQPLVLHPQFVDPFTPLKWLILYILALVSGVSLLLIPPGKFRFPILSPWTRFSLFGVGLGVFGSMLANPGGNYEQHILDWASFALLLGACFQQSVSNPGKSFSAEFRWPMWIATLCVVCFGFTQFFGIELMDGLVKNAFPSSVFGYQNVTAEFIGILLVLFYLSDRPDSKKYQSKIYWIQFSLIISGQIYLFLLASRSALIATGVACFFGRAIRVREGKWAPSLWLACLPLLSLAFVEKGWVPESARDLWSSMFAQGSLPVLSQAPAVSLAQIKRGNVEIRKIRWANTVGMIRENPWGVGPGGYEFGYVPYHARVSRDPESNETMVVRSPHNAYLEWLAEAGWGAGGFLWVALAAGIARFFTLFRAKSVLSHLHPEMLGLVIYFLLDAFFSFPLENPSPFLVAAAALGWHRGQGRHVQGSRWSVALSKGGSAVLLGVVLVLGFNYFISEIAETHPDSLEWLTVGCERFPSNWRVCLAKSQLEMRTKNWAAAESTVRKVLVAQPYHFTALRIASMAQFELGKTREACSLLIKYDELFQGESSAHAERVQMCWEH